MPRIDKSHLNSLRNFEGAIVGNRFCKWFEKTYVVLFKQRFEWCQSGTRPRSVLAVDILPLKRARVTKYQSGKVQSRLRRIDWPFIAIFSQQWQATNVVQMSMGKNHRIQLPIF